jgi:hypothetical protein
MSAQWQSEFTLNCGLRLGGCGLPDMEKKHWGEDAGLAAATSPDEAHRG